MDNIKGGYWVIANVLDVRVSLPVDISPSLRILKASDEQVAQIQRLLTRISSGFSNPRDHYEKHWVKTKASETSWRETGRPLEPKDWRYYIIAYSGNGKDPYDLIRAANLVRPALSSFAQVHTEKEFGVGEVVGLGGDQIQSAMAFEIPRPAEPEVFDDTSVMNLRTSYDRFVALDSTTYVGIARAVDTLQGLKRLSRNNDLRVLALFAVIEMLLTHNPNDKEIGDSLSHQISTKIPLLSARFKTPLEYDVFGKGVTAKKVWKEMYGYRSKIAHGGPIDFGGDLQFLRSREVAVAFLEDATRRLVRHALDEPILVDALKPV